MPLAPERPPRLVDEAAVRRGDERPGERAHERRHVVGHGHELLEGLAARHVGAGKDPCHAEPEDDGQDGCHDGDQQRVAENVRVAAEAGVVGEPVRLRRARLRVAHAQRGLDEINDRIEDEDGGAPTDQHADEPRTRPPGPGPLGVFHSVRLRAP